MASDSLGGGSLKLSVNSSELNRGLEAASAKISGFQTKLTSTVSFFASGGLGAAVAAITSAVSVATSKFWEFADAADNALATANSLGTTTDIVQGLQHGFGMANVDAEGLKAGLKNLVNQMGEASVGSAAAQKAFSQLGLDGAALAAMPLEEALGQVADKLNDLDNPAQRAKAALDIFGKQGLNFLPALQEGSEGIKAMIDEARDLGIAISDTDASSLDAVNDSWERMSAAIDGVFGKIAIALAPAVEDFFNFLTSVIAEAGHLLDGFGLGFTSFGDVALTVLRVVGKSFGMLADSINVCWGAVKVLAGGLVQSFGIVVTAIRKVLEAAGRLPDKLGGKVFRQAAEGVRQFEKGVDEVARGMVESGERTIRQGLSGAAQGSIDNFFDRVEGRLNKLRESDPDRTRKQGAELEGMEGSGKSQEMKTSEALIRGTEAAFSALLKARLTAQGVGGDAQTLLRQQVSESKKQTKSLDNINRTLKNRNGDGVL